MKRHLSTIAFLAILWIGVAFQATYGQVSDIREQLIYRPHQTQSYVSAHRGGRGIPAHPENALETFDYTLAKVPKSIIELDVNITADGTLILMHDESLDRTTSGTGKVQDQSWSYIKELYLKDDYGARTHYRVPSFEQTLEWASKNQAFIMVDVKRNVPFDLVIDLLNKYHLEYYAAIITYSIADAVQVHRLDSDYMISISIRNDAEWQQACATEIPFNRMIAFTGTRITNKSLYDQLHSKGIMCILGTLGNLDKSAEAKGDQLYCNFIQQGIDILATDRPVPCSKTINECGLRSDSKE